MKTLFPAHAQQGQKYATGGNNLSPAGLPGSRNHAPLRFFTGNTGRARFSAAGYFGTGTSNPQARLHVANGKMIIGESGILPSTTHADYLLAVKGKIVGEQMITSMNDWSDEVFKKDYLLVSWEKQQEYYIAEGHLLYVPSEKEVLQKGVDLGKMHAVLLRKLEEAYLYIGELKKESKEMQLKYMRLEKRLDALENKQAIVK